MVANTPILSQRAESPIYSLGDTLAGRAVLGSGTPLASEGGERRCLMYSILYIIGAIVVIIVLLRLLGLY
jgi:hypothetical protein